MRWRAVSVLACAVVLVALVAGVAVASSVATTKPASLVTHHAATLNGIVDTRPIGSAWLFEFGATRALGHYTKPMSIRSGRRPVARTLHTLADGRTYYFRLVVIQGGYMSTARFGRILHFTTKHY